MRTREELITEVNAKQKARQRTKGELIAEIDTEKRRNFIRGLDSVLINDGRVEDYLLTKTPLLAEGYRGNPIATAIESHPDPNEFRAKLTNSVYLADAYNMDFGEAFNLHDSLIKELYGKEVTALSIQQKTKNAKKDIIEARQRQRYPEGFWGNVQLHTNESLVRIGLRGVKGIAGWSEMLGLGIGKVTPLSVQFDDDMREWGRNMSEGVASFYEKHPEILMADAGDDFGATTRMYLSKPEYIYQGVLEAMPMMFEAYFGHLTGMTAAKYVNVTAKTLSWFGRVQGIAVPIMGEEYATLRDRGQSPSMAFPQAFLTAEGEGLVEEWVITKRINIFKGVGKTASKGIVNTAVKMLLGGTKAYARGFGEETVQGMNRNLWNMLFYDSEQKLLDGVFAEGEAGGLIEAAMGGMFAGAGRLQRAGRQMLVSKEEQLARIEAVREQVNKVDWTPKYRKEINGELDKVRTQVENDEYKPPAEAVEKAPEPPAKAITPALAPAVAPERLISQKEHIKDITERGGKPVGAFGVMETPEGVFLDQAFDFEDGHVEHAGVMKLNKAELSQWKEADTAEEKGDRKKAFEIRKRLIEKLKQRYKQQPAPVAPEAEIPKIPETIKEEIDEIALPPEEEIPEILPPDMATAGGIAGEAVSPNLYIGNVTRRMKEKFATIWERQPEEVKGFTEEGFPTKRTAIEMTRGEATEYLTWLVENLESQLSKNLIRTENDLAQANADWGDIATLREALGHSKGTRPFKVIRAKKHIVKVIKDAKSRIWEAIKKPEPSKMTIRQVLNLVMKGVEKASRQAYMAGAREVVAQHKDLARYASQQLKGLDVTQAQRKQLVNTVARTRTQAEKVAAIATINVLAEKARHASAVRGLRKTTRYINKKIGKIMQEKGIRPEYLEKIKAVTDTFVYKKPSEKTKKRVASLKGYIDSLREAEMSKYERDFAEELLPKTLTKHLEEIDVTPVEKMSADEIIDINKELQRLLHLNTVKNKIILDRTARNAAEILNGALAELDNVIDKSKIPEEQTLQTDFQNNSIARQFISWTATTKNHDLETLIDTITGGQKGAAFESVVEMFSNGRETRDNYLNKTADYIHTAMEQNNITLKDLQMMSPGFQRLFKGQKVEAIRKFTTSIFGGVATPRYKVTLAGKEISLTKAEIMSIYMHAQARYNLKAISKEGVASYNRRIGVMSVAEVEKIVATVEADDKAKALCDAVAHIYANFAKNSINKTSLDLKGIELADELDYWHIERFTAGGIAGAETYRLSLLESEGRIQPRTGSRNPIIIRDFFEVFFNDRQSIAEYVGMSKAYRAAKMLFNYKVYREKIKGLGYNEELRNIGEVIRNTEQHPYDRAPIDAVIMRILRGTVRAVLANPGIWLGQYTSVNGYFNEASAKYRTAQILKPPSEAEMERYKEHWPFLKARAEGGVSSIALQDIAQNDMALRMFTGKTDYVSFFTTMIHRIDIRAIGVAGKITEAEMADKGRNERSKDYWDRQGFEPSELEKDSEEYWDAFRKRARFLARRTQPMFEGENRSVHTGVTAPSRKMWFLFRSYVDQSLRMAYREYTARQNNSISRTKFVSKLANVWVTLASFAALQWMIGKLLYRSDDDWADLIWDIMAAPLKILTIVGYPIKVVLERLIDVKRGKRPAFYKPKVDTVAVSVVNRMIDATALIMDGLSYLGTGETYQSGPHQYELKSEVKLKQGMLMLIENVASLYGIPADEVRRSYRGWTKEEKETPLALK